jgi:hypothetical protein
VFWVPVFWVPVFWVPVFWVPVFWVPVFWVLVSGDPKCLLDSAGGRLAPSLGRGA